MKGTSLEIVGTIIERGIVYPLGGLDELENLAGAIGPQGVGGQKLLDGNVRERERAGTSQQSRLAQRSEQLFGTGVAEVALEPIVGFAHPAFEVLASK